MNTTEQLTRRVRNAAINLSDETIDPELIVKDLYSIAHDIYGYVPEGLTADEFKDIDLLHEIAVRHGKFGDGQDHDLLQHIQDIQKILMIRAGGRSYLAQKEAHARSVAKGSPSDQPADAGIGGKELVSESSMEANDLDELF